MPAMRARGRMDRNTAYGSTPRSLRSAMAALAILLPAALPAAQWKDFAELPGQPLRASFAPYADTRHQVFDRTDFTYYGSVYALVGAPGEIVVEPADAATPPAGPLSLRMEAIPVARNDAGIPKLPSNAHFAANPFLPLTIPAGHAEPPAFVAETLFPANAAYPLRAPLHLPENLYRLQSIRGKTGPYDYDSILRIRWTVAGGDGRTVATGLLPDGFARAHFGSFSILVSKEGVPEDIPHERKSEGRMLLTQDSIAAWPLILEKEADIVLSRRDADAISGGDRARCDEFRRRARLLNAAVTIVPGENDGADAAEDAVGEAQPRLIIAPSIGEERYRSHESPLHAETPSTVQHGYRYAHEAGNMRRRAEGLMAPARIPGATIGRSMAVFCAVTVLFMLVFATGTGVILYRILSRRGEARLAVWRALPLWSAAAALFAIFALPLLVDRSPRADVTEWRYAVAGGPEELRICAGRAQTFLRHPTRWTFPADGWFCGKSIASLAAEKTDLSAGVATLAGAPRPRGEMEHAKAARFAPHESSPVSATADTIAYPQSPEEFRETLAVWISRLPSLRWAPEIDTLRTVTANRDFSGVWIFTRNRWFALGPMRKGESATPNPINILHEGMDTKGKNYWNLFHETPFNVLRHETELAAEAWMSAYDAAKSKGEPLPEIDHALAARLDDTVVFALRPSDSAATDLAPAFDGGGKPKVFSRIVEVEVFE